ncbi:MAG: hypothetical protein H6712_02930 [Myxococcales bacterium]|nr:hypothetical protein [Myxococcales bacterium]MCB9712781.1 hypothetical protein [Myxococcales bacterium]
MRAFHRPIAPVAPDGGALAERLTTLARRQELFLRGATWPHRLRPAALEQSEAAWFGVGVTTGGRLSRGLPLDVLGLLYAQELVRRTLGWSRSMILVADSNAQAAGLDALAVRRLGVQVERRLRETIAQLDFPVEVRLSSSLGRPSALPGFARLAGLPPYVALQLAQTERMRELGAGLKLGWAWPGAVQDERYFDDLYRREYGPGIASIYVSGGSTLDPRRPRACPYVCSTPESRLLLRPGEELERKLSRAPRTAARRYQRLLGKLARAHCRLTGTERSRRPWVVLQGLLDELPCAP